jgi:hypothetical protein
MIYFLLCDLSPASRRKSGECESAQLPNDEAALTARLPLVLFSDEGCFP